MPFEDYLKWFKGTMVNLDQNNNAYTIHNLSVDMNKEREIFLKFKLKEPIDCAKDVFTIIVEQQGKQLQQYCREISAVAQSNTQSAQKNTKTKQALRFQDVNNIKFTPSEFSLMLIRIIDGDANKFELIEHNFDSHLKLQMRPMDKILKAGKYIIVAAPKWNESSTITPSFRKVITGIYAPI